MNNIQRIHNYMTLDYLFRPDNLDIKAISKKKLDCRRNIIKSWNTQNVKLNN